MCIIHFFHFLNIYRILENFEKEKKKYILFIFFFFFLIYHCQSKYHLTFWKCYFKIDKKNVVRSLKILKKS